MIKERMSLMEVVAAMKSQQLVLPLFQRPFVWSEEQVCDLFDSLLQGYPLGNILLLEDPPPDLKNRLQCCFFHPHSGSQHQEASLQQRRREAQIFERLPNASHLVIDGQQRLFAFYIGVSGSYMRTVGPSRYESCQLCFNLYPLAQLFCCEQAEGLRSEHHQFRFYSQTEVEALRAEISQELLRRENALLRDCDPAAFLLPVAQIQQWGRDRRTAKSEIRRFLRALAPPSSPGSAKLSAPLSGGSKALLDELEDLLDSLHNHLWISEPVKNSTVAPQNSYDLLEIFSRLNQGASFRASDLHYAVRIVFPQPSKAHSADDENNAMQHNFSRYLKAGSPQPPPARPQAAEQPTGQPTAQPLPQPPAEAPTHLEGQHYSAEELAELSGQEQGTQIFHQLNRQEQPWLQDQDGISNGSGGRWNINAVGELEEHYEKLLQIADELKLDLNFLYHCYLFCEAEEPQQIARNIRKREGALALRNNAQHLLRFAKTLDRLRDAIDAANFIVRQWFQDNLHNDYVLLPVLYYFYKQTTEYLDPLNDLQDINLSRIVRWIALNEVSPSVFRGGMQQLAKLWPVLHHSMQQAMTKDPLHFPLQDLHRDLEQAFAPSRSLVLSDTSIAELLQNTCFKHRACVPLLALLYSHPRRIALMQRYEERQIDFIQPQKLLTRRALKNYGLENEQLELNFSRRDSILNLQWLPRRLLTEKGDIPFRQWLCNSQQLKLLGEQNEFSKKELVVYFMRFHYIKREEGIYSLNAFTRFLKEREKLMFRALQQCGQDFSNWDAQAAKKKIPFAAF